MYHFNEGESGQETFQKVVITMAHQLFSLATGWLRNGFRSITPFAPKSNYLKYYN